MKKFVLILTLFVPLIFLQQSVTNGQTGMFNMSYLYFGSLSSYVNQVEKTNGSLTVVSPNYFDISKEGQLVTTWRLQTSFISEMHKRGIKVVPFLANHWDATAGINGLNNREVLAQDIAAAIEKYSLDGIHVDIEGVGHSYRDAHTDFIRLLRQYISKDKEVSVAVAANPNGWKTGWHGFYDYNGLGQHSDYLMIMAYDESWESPDSPIGPVSSVSFFERSIQFAINQGVPKHKIVAGLPFYGRIWKTDGVTLENKRITGMGLSSTRVQPLISQFNGKISFDENKQSPFATFTIPNEQSAFIGSTKLTQGNYIIWFENEQSIRAKLKLPKQYGIKGTGSWALAHETPETWTYYSQALNQFLHTFKDIKNHWAEADISEINKKGWMFGVTSTSFEPEDNLTRAQAAVIISRTLGLKPNGENQVHFNDIESNWAKNEIQLVAQHGFMNGMNSDTFGGNVALTREQFAVILDRILLKLNKVQPEVSAASLPFKDIPPNRWSKESIVRMNQIGVINGVTATLFNPTHTLTRAQMAVMMNRSIPYLEDLR
jgi:spore germination protein YaaH